jgi:hypothetical protein
VSRYFGATIYGILYAMVIGSAVMVFGPVLETYLYPAYSRFEVVSIEPTKDGQTRARFRFTKHRACVPHGFTWFSGEAGAEYREVDVVINQDKSLPPVRPIGEQLTSEYILGVEPSVLERGVYAEIYSRCHPFWITTSIVYP